MNASVSLEHKFVDSVPEEMADHTIYISIKYNTVMHKCCCGCGNKVVTPLKPSRWSLTYDGCTISLHPSVGNHGYGCRSHYWIKQSKVSWSRQWTDVEVVENRRSDAIAIDRDRMSRQTSAAKAESVTLEAPPPAPKSWIARMKRRIFGRS